MANIISNLNPSPEKAVREASPEEKALFAELSDKPWRYLGKGCQSYAFESENGEYVLKFFKHQRFRSRAWMAPLYQLPLIQESVRKKQAHRAAKLAGFMESWRLAFDELSEESGIIWVHLNKSSNLNKDFILKDKVGLTHKVPADSVEFLIQRKAEPLEDWIHRTMKEGHPDKVRAMLSDLLATLMNEYERGLSDNDPALLQNTGVFNDRPFHIDVGQFEKNNRFKNPDIWSVELYNKTYFFRLWLLETYPEMGEHLTLLLKEILGPKWDEMKPYFGRIH